MNADSIVLYKLIILYMLDRVDFTLTNAQITDLVIAKKYTDYFTLQSSINEMIETDYISASTIRNSTHYKITMKGEEALAMFENRIPYAIKQDIMEFFDTQRINLRQESEIYSDYQKNENGEYTVSCVIKERNATLIDLKFSVPTKSHAVSICDNWREKSTAVYEQLINSLWFN